MILWLLRLLQPETTHNLVIWSLRTGFWRVGLTIEALITLTWAIPARWLFRLLSKWDRPDKGRSEDDHISNL
jgi:hypothetical protein